MVRIFFRRLCPYMMVVALAIFSTGAVSAQSLPPDFSEALILGGFTEAVGATWDTNGRAYVWEKAGLVWIVENGERLPEPLIDLREEVGNWRDHGLLGFTLDPQFLMNGRFYLLYVVDRHHLMNYGTPSYDPNEDDHLDATIVRLTRYEAIGPEYNTVNAASRTILLGETPQTGGPVLHESHGAGSLAFGTDGTLLATIGDGATYSTVDVGNAIDSYHTQGLADGIIRPEENVGALRAQMVNSLSGKLLRLDPETGDGVEGNPWYDASAPRAPRSRVWAMGLRNAYRFTVRPGSGSTSPADADPGTIYLGDVGWNFWEELLVSDSPGLNYGWPLFEGYDANSYYMPVLTPNMDAPNPLYNGVDCDQQYFNFQDLLVQATPVHLNMHPNPCDPAVQIPNSIPKHFHARPEIDYRHGDQARTGGFLGDVAITYNLNDPNSPVPGPSFGGYAIIGGPWMEGTQFPIGYQGATFHADFAGGFIKRFMFNELDEPVSVHHFASGLGAITWLGAGPDGCIWYIQYNTHELRRICYDLAVDLPPVAVAEQSVQYGPSPLQVSFTGSNSYDPGGGAITYHWDLGDDTESTDPDPMHTYTAPAGVPTTFNVILTVTDTAGQSASANLIVSVNNTPPVVEITSFEDGDFYEIGVETLLALEAAVSDAEHGPGELAYEWRTSLHHNTHVHPEPIDTDPVTSTIISGVGCDGESYSYRITLKVIDAGGLSTTTEKWLYPACHLIAPTAVIEATPTIGFAPLEVQFDGSSSYDPGEIVGYAWDFGDGTFSNEPAPIKTFISVGSHFVTLVVTDDDGLTSQATRMINVIDLSPPQCVGAIGGILREVWTDIPGSTLASLVGHPSYAGPPSSTSILPNLQAPVNSGTNYGARLRGYIVPEVTGTYVFTLTSDDASIVYLSPNSDPLNKQQIANVPGLTMDQEYDKYASQVSGPIELLAGVYYYIEILHKQGTSTDHLTLRWQIDGAPDRVVVPGSALAPWEDCAPWIQFHGMLEGAATSSEVLMRDDLRAAGLIPLEEPYSTLGLMVSNAGASVDAELFADTGQNAIVDWVLVELRSAGEPSTVVASHAALLQRDGDIMGTDGYTRLLFEVDPGEYHIALRHRNHLGVMTASPFLVDENGVLVDLSDPTTATWGVEAQKQLVNGRNALWAGNVVHDDVLKYTGAENDAEPILLSIGGLVPTNVALGYDVTDVNMDGVIRYTGRNNDRDPILINVGGSTPTAVRMEQLP